MAIDRRALTVQMILQVVLWSRDIAFQKVAFSGRLRQRLMTSRFCSLGHYLVLVLLCRFAYLL